MIASDGRFIAQPPPWPPISNHQFTNNIREFWDMEVDSELMKSLSSKVLTNEQFRLTFRYDSKN